MSRAPFTEWVAHQLGLTADDVDAMKLAGAFEVFVSRLEAARRRGASDPLVTITTKRAGGNSRLVTRRMLRQLGYTPTQLRATHRLIAGSGSGWPGLLRLYALNLDLDARQRQYARRQLLYIRGEHLEPSGREASARQVLSDASPGCVTRAGIP